MPPAAWAVAAELEAVGVVLLVLLRRVGPLPTFGAGQRDDWTVLGLRHGELLLDRGDGAGADGAAALADGEALAGLEGDGRDELDAHLDVVAGHDHLGALGQGDGPGDVGGAQVELRAVAVVEGRVAAALVLGEHVDLGPEAGVGLDGAGLGEDLAALDVVALEAPQQGAHVVAGLARVEQLVEHLHAGDDDLAGGPDADQLDLVADLDQAALDAPGGHGAAALDAEDVLDGHEEGLVDGPLGGGDVGIDRVHELGDGRVGGVGGVVAGLQGGEGRAADDGDVVAGELVLAEQLADLQLDQLEQLGVVDHVDLVEEDDDVGHLHLAGQEDVLAGLGHGPVGGGHHEDGAVHLGRAGDHVLDVVGVAGAVDVGVGGWVWGGFLFRGPCSLRRGARPAARGGAGGEPGGIRWSPQWDLNP